MSKPWPLLCSTRNMLHPCKTFPLLFDLRFPDCTKRRLWKCRHDLKKPPPTVAKRPLRFVILDFPGPLQRSSIYNFFLSIEFLLREQSWTVQNYSGLGNKRDQKDPTMFHCFQFTIFYTHSNPRSHYWSCVRWAACLDMKLHLQNIVARNIACQLDISSVCACAVVSTECVTDSHCVTYLKIFSTTILRFLLQLQGYQEVTCVLVIVCCEFIQPKISRLESRPLICLNARHFFSPFFFFCHFSHYCCTKNVLRWEKSIELHGFQGPMLQDSVVRFIQKEPERCQFFLWQMHPTIQNKALLGTWQERKKTTEAVSFWHQQN